MGKLAFAPATPEVLKLAAHLGKTHEFFDESFHGVFRYEIAIPSQGSTMIPAWCALHPPRAAFGNPFILGCRTESEAEDFIGGSAERLWALVVFDNGPADQGAGTPTVIPVVSRV